MFTAQKSFLKLLKKDYGDTNVKSKYITLNNAYLDSDDMANLNQETLSYKRNSKDGAVAFTTLFTLGSLIYGIIKLPARKSTVKYTAIGLATGVFFSYGFWRFQLYKYDQKVNFYFKKILKERF
jgi:heme/copper-type cytochrome/quinol oxidase subunit 3